LTWNQYDGWKNPEYNVYINYRNQWVLWNPLPIIDTNYCIYSDTLDVGSYLIKVTTQDSGYISESNYVICVQPEPPTVVIPNVFTPNQDGFNDLFVIRNLLFSDHRPLVIKNRWGKTVYETLQYNNDWDGGNVTDGVYYGFLRTNFGNEFQQYLFVVTIFHY
jgi:gliding motility-associated-like protein